MTTDCFLCLEGEDSSKGKLFHPCHCSYIHQKCLEELRSRMSKYNYQCPICKYHYKFSHVLFASFLTHPVTISIFTFLTVSFSVIVVALFIRLFVYVAIGATLTSQRAFMLSGKFFWWIFLIIGFITIALVNNNGQNNFPTFTLYDSRLIEWTGYGLSFVGFFVFIKSIYDYIRDYFTILLQRWGQRIIEI